MIFVMNSDIFTSLFHQNLVILAFPVQFSIYRITNKMINKNVDKLFIKPTKNVCSVKTCSKLY